LSAQDIASSVSAPAGDSGAVIFKQIDDSSAAAVGMIIGAGGLLTYAFPLQPALEVFRCRLFSGSAAKRAERPS
jgi:hypothetical protein